MAPQAMVQTQWLCSTQRSVARSLTTAFAFSLSDVSADHRYPGLHCHLQQQCRAHQRSPLENTQQHRRGSEPPKHRVIRGHGERNTRAGQQHQAAAAGAGIAARAAWSGYAYTKEPSASREYSLFRVETLTEPLTQTDFARSKFVEALQSYQQVERDYRARYKQRVERQFKIGTFCPPFHIVYAEPPFSQAKCYCR